MGSAHRLAGSGADGVEAALDPLLTEVGAIGGHVALGLGEDLLAHDRLGGQTDGASRQEEVTQTDRVEDVGVEENQRTDRGARHAHRTKPVGNGVGDRSVVVEADGFGVLGEDVESSTPAFEICS